MTIHNEPLTAWDVVKMAGLALVLAAGGFLCLLALMLYL